MNKNKNVIVADKKVHLQYLDMEAAIAHCTKGVGIWDWASNDQAAAQVKSDSRKGRQTTISKSEIGKKSK